MAQLSNSDGVGADFDGEGHGDFIFGQPGTVVMWDAPVGDFRLDGWMAVDGDAPSVDENFATASSEVLEAAPCDHPPLDVTGVSAVEYRELLTAGTAGAADVVLPVSSAERVQLVLPPFDGDHQVFFCDTVCAVGPPCSQIAGQGTVFPLSPSVLEPGSVHWIVMSRGPSGARWSQRLAFVAAQ